MHRHSKGFSLIELLVVIAIIAILAAILFPIFLTAKEKGKETTCKSNAKQIAHAVQMYLDDWNGCYADQTSVGIPYKDGYSNEMGAEWLQKFAHRYRDDYGRGPAGLSKALMPYIKNLAIFKCPSEWKDKQKAKYSGVVWLPYICGSSYYYKHALNTYANSHKKPLKLSDITYPSKVSLLYEESWHYCKENPMLWNQPDTVPTKRCLAVFTDCHVGVIEIPYNSRSGYDGNWYHYDNTHGKTNPECGFWEVNKGARDIP